MGALAAPDTRLGQLQRGRGAGWLAVIACPDEAREDVLACVVDDPRLDRQVESRAEYYAQLVAAVGGPVDRIAERLRELTVGSANERDAWLAIDVLREMSLRGDDRATEMLEQAADGRFHELVRGHEPVKHEPGQSPAERFREFRVSIEASTTERLVELAASPTTREGRIAARLDCEATRRPRARACQRA